MSFWGHFWWFEVNFWGLEPDRKPVRVFLGLVFGTLWRSVFEVIFGCFWGHFWSFLRSFFDHFCVIFGSILGVFGYFGDFWSVLLYPSASFLGWCQIFAFLVIFDLFWPFLGPLTGSKKTPKPLFGPPKSHFPRRSRLQFSVNTKIQFWQKSTPSILDPPIELFIDPTSHSIFQNVKNCKIRKSPTAQNSKSQSKVALSKLCVKSEKWLFRCAHFLNVLCKKCHFLMFLCIRKTPFLDFSGHF